MIVELINGPFKGYIHEVHHALPPPNDMGIMTIAGSMHWYHVTGTVGVFQHSESQYFRDNHQAWREGVLR